MFIHQNKQNTQEYFKFFAFKWWQGNIYRQHIKKPHSLKHSLIFYVYFF